MRLSLRLTFKWRALCLHFLYYMTLFFKLVDKKSCTRIKKRNAKLITPEWLSIFRNTKYYLPSLSCISISCSLGWCTCIPLSNPRVYIFVCRLYTRTLLSPRANETTAATAGSLTLYIGAMSFRDSLRRPHSSSTLADRETSASNVAIFNLDACDAVLVCQGLRKRNGLRVLHCFLDFASMITVDNQREFACDINCIWEILDTCR